MCLAYPARVVEIISADRVKVDVDGVFFEASTLLIDPPKIGGYLLIHAGFAIENIAEDLARDKLELWAEFRAKEGSR